MPRLSCYFICTRSRGSFVELATSGAHESL